MSGVKDALDLLARAEKASKFSETKMNKMSNRAHRIFTIIAEYKRYETNVTSTLTFIDLAGSEDISKSGAEGLTAREAMYINKSLLTLGRVINALACNEKHIPYRDSKLTRLLSEALGGVCKTSFIACVSPCLKSSTESSSTLRYAERAMEALNITQLPRWKQDEIVIDGLTRRVQALMLDLDTQAKIHKEEVQELQNENAALQVENESLRTQLRKARFKIEKLEVRKVQLKNGLNVIHQHRDLLQEQKELLREELLETRMERDGYLNDRAILSQVLADVREMRNKLLEAHTQTEDSLTTDATHLKRTIEESIVDIDSLHEEINRKKSLSVHNEKSADEYRDRLTGKVKGVIKSVSDFKTGQDTLHNELAELLGGMKDANQKDAATNRSALTSLSDKTAEVLTNITNHARETEQALSARISERKSDAERYRTSVSVAVGKFRTSVAGQLETLRSHAASLQANMGDWASKIKTKLDERTQEVNKFTGEVKTGLVGMQSSVDSATSKQLELLEAHSLRLARYLEEERTTLSSDSESLIKEIQLYVSRVISDFSSKTVRRTETAVADFKADAESSSREVRTFAADQTAQNTALQVTASEWGQTSAVALQDAVATNKSSHQSSVAMLDSVSAASKETEQKASAGAQETEQLANAHLEATQAVCTQNASFVEKKRDELQAKAQDASKALQADVNTMRAAVQGQSDKYGEASATLKTSMTSTITDVRTHAEDFTDSLADTEADGVAYVMQEIKRDTTAPPAKKKYAYPVQYKRTAAYDNILNDLTVEWSREAQIRDGDMPPGKGPDFPGDLGSEDPSGVLDETADQPVPATEAESLSKAGRESDAEEYEGELANQDSLA